MFARLKNKVKEESTSDLLAVGAGGVVQSRGDRSLKDSSSNVSDGHQSSSDDAHNPSNSRSARPTPAAAVAVEKSSVRTANDTVLNKVEAQKNQAGASLNHQNVNSVNGDHQETALTGAVAAKSDQHDESVKSQLKQLNQSLLNQIESLKNELKQNLNENEELRIEINKLNSQLEANESSYERSRLELEDECDKLRDEIAALKNDKHDLLIKNAELSQKYELLKLLNNKQQQQIQSQSHAASAEPLGNHPRTTSLSQNPSESRNEPEATSPTTKSIKEDNNNNVQQKLDENRSLKEELNEKNKLIKNLQQRLNDMKKTLQKELKYQSFPNEQRPPSVAEGESPAAHRQQQQQQQPTSQEAAKNGLKSTAQATPPVLEAKAQLVKKTPQQPGFATGSQTTMGGAGVPGLSGKRNSIQPNSHLSNLHEDVNFKYLKHVVLKFVTSREYEALHLVKALSVLLNFTNEEEKVLKESLEWKMSWFGTKPKVT